MLITKFTEIYFIFILRYCEFRVDLGYLIYLNFHFFAFVSLM